MIPMVLRGGESGFLGLFQDWFYSGRIAVLAGRAVMVPAVPDWAYSCHPQRRPPMPRSLHQRSRKRVPKPDRRATAAKPRPWHVSLMRSRAHFLGIVYAADQEAAEPAAVAEFKIGDDQHRRLIVREQE